MANFCPACATPLDSDAKFCPSCSAPVSVSAALASEFRAGMQAGVRLIVQAPSMKVPPPIWAGVIEVLWVFVSIGGGLVYTVLAGGGFVTAGVGGLFGGAARAERLAVWLIASAMFYLVQLSFQIPLAVGFFTLRRWAYGLYLWSVGPLVLLGLILRFTQPPLEELESKLPLSMSMILTGGWLLLLVLIGLQIYLVLKSKDQLVR